MMRHDIVRKYAIDQLHYAPRHSEAAKIHTGRLEDLLKVPIKC
jgi:hypothetical protein